MAKKSKETKGEIGIELGQSGTQIFKGIITEEYVSELSGTRAMRTYDEMRKSDSTVQAGILAVTLPIRRAQWMVTPASEDARDLEVANFISEALFELHDLTWDNFLRQALLSVVFGVMVFEKVFDVAEVEGKQRVIWKKFGPRMPKSIQAWELSNGQKGIVQMTLNGGTAEIPIEKLLVFVNDMEGENYWGTSCLRSAYKPWYMKSNMEKIDAIAIERQGVGLPFVKLSAGASDDDKRTARNVLSNIFVKEDAFLIEPDGVSVDFKDMKATQNRDAAKSIEYHDRQILKSVLAQFISLGSGSSGSRALSEDQSALFLQSIEAIANNVLDVINKDAIKELVDLNFDGIEKYPKLDYTGIQRTDVDGLSVAYQRLVQSGAIIPMKADERYLRETLGLPEKSKEEMDRDEEDRKAKEAAAAAELELAAAQNGLKKKDSQQDPANANELSEMITGIVRNQLIKMSGFAEGDFKGWRKLTFAEKKVNFNRLQDFMDKQEAKLSGEAVETLSKAKEEYVAKIAKALAANDLKKVKELELGYEAEYRALLKDAMKKSFEFGKNGAASEMNVAAPANPSDMSKTLDLYADSVAKQHAGEIVSDSKIAVVNKLNRGENAVAAAAAADAAMTSAIKRLARDASAIVVSGSLNGGRKAVFDKYASKIHALQRSEILDLKTCAFCLSMDGRIVEKSDSMASFGPFHSNCRGIWVEIMKDEEELPEITGIPQSLRDRIGDAANELVQPKNPLVKKDSPAARAIAKGKAASESSLSVGYCECGGNH